MTSDVIAPPNYTRTTSGRRSGAFSVFASFAVSEENFAKTGEYLDRRVAEDRRRALGIGA